MIQLRFLFSFFILTTFFSLYNPCYSGISQPKNNWITWDSTSINRLPVQKGLSSAFVGVHKEVLIVAGGSNFDKPAWEKGTKIYWDSIFVCINESDSSYRWIYAGKLPYPLAHGAAISTPDGIICLGGQNKDGKSDAVFLLQWDEMQKKVIIGKKYASLPLPASHIAAAFLDKKIYVAGGMGTIDGKDVELHNFWQLNLKKEDGSEDLMWKDLIGWPGSKRFGASLVKQSNGGFDCLYLFSGKCDSTYLKDAYVYNPHQIDTSKIWSGIADLPRAALVAPSLALGMSQIIIISGSDGHDVKNTMELKDNYHFVQDILSYNTITNVWYTISKIPQGVAATTAIFWKDKIIIPGGEIRQSVRTSVVFEGTIVKAGRSNFSLIDYITLFGYLGLIVLLGIYFSYKTKSTKDFFLGGQKIPFWAAGLSMMAAQVSSIGFMSIPAKSFATNWSYFAGVFTWFIVVPIVIYAFVPFYRRLNVTSAYEYLEKRFNRFVRLFVSALYLLFQLLGRLGAIIYLPAIALSAVTNIDTVVCIFIIGLLATLYTAMGGMLAIIWIDVLQAIIKFGGIALCFVYVFLNLDGGVGEFTRVAFEDHKFSFGSFDVNLTMAVFWVIIVGNVFTRISTMTSDQSVVQRYLTTKNEKETAKALWTDVAISIPWALFAFSLGTVLFVFYKSRPELLDPIMATDGLVPYFIGQNLPPGIRGIIISALFAASMSSVDSSIHSSTTVLMRDFLGPSIKDMAEKKKVALARYITFGLGAMGIMIAIGMTFFNITSVWDIILEVAGLFGGAMTGLFVLGIFTRSANGKGAMIGAVGSAIIMFLVKNNTPLHFFLYGGLGIISSFVVGYLASLFFKHDKSLDGLTIFTLNKKTTKEGT